jgi:hypothetical protein
VKWQKYRIVALHFDIMKRNKAKNIKEALEAESKRSEFVILR